jgi:hypothetical protein
MITFARTYLGQIGQIQGDAEVKIYKLLKSVFSGRNVETDNGIVSMGVSETGVRQVLINGKPALQHPVELIVDTLDKLESIAQSQCDQY